MTTPLLHGQVGDVIVIEEHHLGEGRRIGEILEVLKSGATEHYRMRWDDGSESIFFPSSDAHIHHHRADDEPVLRHAP